MKIWDMVERVPMSLLGGVVMVLWALATAAIWHIAEENGDPTSRAMAWMFTVLVALFYCGCIWAMIKKRD